MIKLRVIAGPPRKPKARSRKFKLPVTETTVLKPRKVLSAPAPGSPGEIVYDGRARLRRGHFVALDVGDRTPYGWLGKVTKATADRKRGTKTVAVEPVSLFEAVPAGHIRIRPRRGRAQRTGTEAPASAMRAAGRRQFRHGLECTAGTTAEAGAEAELSLRPKLALDWGWFSVDSAEVEVTATGTARAWATLSAEGQCTLDERKLFQRTFTPITVSVGPVPVVLTPQLIVYVSAEASASGSLSTSIDGTLSATGGLQYEDGDVSPIGDFDHSFNFERPAPRGEGSIGAQVIPAANLLLYGVVGPQVELSAGPQLDIDTATHPAWRLHVPVDLSAQLVVPLSGDEFGPLTVYETDFLLAQGDYGAPVGFWSGSEGSDVGYFNIGFDVTDPGPTRIEDFSGVVQGNGPWPCRQRAFGSPIGDPISLDVAADGSFVFHRPRLDIRGRFVSPQRVEGTFRVLPRGDCDVTQRRHAWFAEWNG